MTMSSFCRILIDLSLEMPGSGSGDDVPSFLSNAVAFKNN